MDLQLTEEQRLLVEQVRRFVAEEIVPLEAHLDPDASELEPADRERLVDGFYKFFVMRAGSNGLGKKVDLVMLGTDGSKIGGNNDTETWVK